MRPLAIELFAGLHGWGAELASAGFRVAGFDIADMCAALGEPRPEGCHLVLQDVLTLHGSQFRNAGLIVASPPCPEYSYRRQPWKRARAKTPEQLGVPEPAWWKKTEGDSKYGKMNADELAEWRAWQATHPTADPDNALFDACFRIQREASEAAGRYIPMVVENVEGAQPWVGRAKAHYGSFFLWGDVASVGGRIVAGCQFGGPSLKADRSGVKALGQKIDSGQGKAHEWWKGQGEGRKARGDWFNSEAASPMRRCASGSKARNAASARAAKIPPKLAYYIGRVFLPDVLPL